MIRPLPHALLALAFGALLAPAAPHATADPGLPTMPVLARVDVPSDRTSMSIAFDGEVFYFIDNTTTTTSLARVRLTGTAPDVSSVALPLLPLPPGDAPQRIAYDARHHALLLARSVESHTEVRRYDLRTHRVDGAAVTLADDQTAGFAYDWRTDRFLVSADGTNVWRYDALGHRRKGCLADQSQIVSVLSGLVASGDGEVYEQLEDDQTLLRAGADCRTTGTWTHRILAEATAEDDALACDGATFGVPAVWVRDPATATMTAYGLPAGRCVLPTVLRLAVRSGHACAVLARAEVAVPLAGQPVSVAGQVVRTGADGTACAAVPATPGSHTVVASYAGSRGWAPSRAAAAYRIAPGAVPPSVRPPLRQRAPRLRSVAGPPGAPGVPPGAAAAAGPPPAPHAQGPQPAPDPASAGVPVANALPAGVAVPQPQERGAPAYAMVDANAAARSSMVPVVQAFGAALASAFAVAAARRRTAPAYNRR